MIKDTDLIFEQIRERSPQWEVSTEGAEPFAIVTERIIAEPTYAVRLLYGEGTEHFFEDRDAVCAFLLPLMGVSFLPSHDLEND